MSAFLQLPSLQDDPHIAVKFVVDLLVNRIWPLIKEVRKKLQSPEAPDCNGDLIKKLSDVFTVCCSQLNKCIINLFEIFKLENRQRLILHESRQCTMERLSWCINRLNTISETLDTRPDPDLEDSFLATSMYFVNWIDHTFEVLTKLSDVVYRTDYRNTEQLFELWKNEVVDIVSDLHLSLDELLLSAMTLCKYCMPCDQPVVRARCQVVLRETKSLLTELINEDLDSVYKVTTSSLKLPMMPSNINVLIDVLKDALYVLETNTNTALLALLVHCFSKVCPVKELRDHLKGNKGTCSCGTEVEDCSLIQEFDLHNERLMQIGTFAVSCSSDQNRISILRSGLASLEALDPHLIPALILSPESPHAELLINSWIDEVGEIRDSVFLIVDPAAFSEKCKKMMNEQLLQIIAEDSFGEQAACSFANTATVMLDFFNAYTTLEPEALLHRDKLVPIVADLGKAQSEVKIVINLLSNKTTYEVQMPKSIKVEVSFSKLKKRLKLVYTLVSRINELFHPKEIEDQLFELCEPKNGTHVINKNPNIGTTYVNSPKREINASRTFFARTNARTPSKVLSKLTKHLNAKRNGDLTFSMKIDEMFDLTEPKNKHLDKIKEKSILYHSPKKNKSLRKAVLSRHCKVPLEMVQQEFADSVEEDLIDATTSLQITEILDQMSDISNVLRNPKRGFNSTRNITNKTTTPKNVLKIDLNKEDTFISKRIWSIPVNGSKVELRLDESGDKSESERSDVTTQERLHDLDLVESRLSKLKMCQQETSL